MLALLVDAYLLQLTLYLLIKSDMSRDKLHGSRFRWVAVSERWTSVGQFVQIGFVELVHR